MTPDHLAYMFVAQALQPLVEVQVFRLPLQNEWQEEQLRKSDLSLALRFTNPNHRTDGLRPDMLVLFHTPLPSFVLRATNLRALILATTCLDPVALEGDLAGIGTLADGLTPVGLEEPLSRWPANKDFELWMFGTSSPFMQQAANFALDTLEDLMTGNDLVRTIAFTYQMASESGDPSNIHPALLN
jgi:hypothetical protein